MKNKFVNKKYENLSLRRKVFFIYQNIERVKKLRKKYH